MDWAEGFGAGEAVGVAIVGGMRGFGGEDGASKVVGGCREESSR